MALRKNIIFALLSLFFMPTVAQVKQIKNPYGYLYCHMSRKGEWTAFALSRDGINWHDLNNGNEVYDTRRFSEIEGGARDAYINRAADGKGFVIHIALPRIRAAGNRSIPKKPPHCHFRTLRPSEKTQPPFSDGLRL